MQEELLKDYVELFRDKTETELDELAQSFLLGMCSVKCELMTANCEQRERLCQILSEDAKQ